MSERHYNIEGIWLVDHKPLGEPCILVIMKGGRTVQFPTSRTLPKLNQTMRLWHTDYDGSQIRFKPSPTAEGWIRGIESTKTGWNIIALENGATIRFHCTPIATKDLPSWYEQMLIRNLELMAETVLKSRNP